MTDMFDGDTIGAFRAANEMAIKWFEIHAEQRLKLFNFFIIVAGFCIAGFFAALQAENRIAASVISAVLVVVSYCFKQLDRRTSQLRKIAEDFLKESLGALGTELKSEKVNFVKLAEEKGRLWSYRQIFNVLFWVFGILGLLGTAFPWLAD